MDMSSPLSVDAINSVMILSGSNRQIALSDVKGYPLGHFHSALSRYSCPSVRHSSLGALAKRNMHISFLLLRSSRKSHVLPLSVLLRFGNGSVYPNPLNSVKGIGARFQPRAA